MILTDSPKLNLSFDKFISYPYAKAVSEVSRFLLDDGSSTDTMNMCLYLASRISTSDANTCVSFRIYKQYKTLIRWREIPQPKQFLILSYLLTTSVPEKGYSKNMSGIFKLSLF